MIIMAPETDKIKENDKTENVDELAQKDRSRGTGHVPYNNALP